MKHPIRCALCIGLALAVPAAAATRPHARHKSHNITKPAPAPAPPPAPPAKVGLDPARDTLTVTPPAISASGTVQITFQSITPADVTLRIVAARQTDPAPRIAWGPGNIERRSVPLALSCHDAGTCTVPFTVLHVAAAGTQDLHIEAHDSAHADALLGSADLRVLREKPPVQAELTGDGIDTSANAVVLSLLRTRNFTFHLKNPGNSEAIIPVIGAALPDCAGHPNRRIIRFTPIDKALEPGADTTVYATVDKCVKSRIETILRITDQNGGGAEIFARRLIVDPALPVARLMRRLPIWPVWYVLLGAVASITLNNFFPFQRSRRTLRQFLAQAETKLSDCANLSSGLADALAAQVASCRAALNALSWFFPSKTRLLGDIQATITALDATLKIASKLDQHRMTILSKEDYLSTSSCAAIAARLLDAEDALLAGDAEAAGLAMADAQKRFDAIFADTEQVALRTDLNRRLGTIAKELGAYLADGKAGHDQNIDHIARRLETATLGATAGRPDIRPAAGRPAPLAAAPAAQPAAAPATQAAAPPTTQPTAPLAAQPATAPEPQPGVSPSKPQAYAVPREATVNELLAIERDIFVMEMWFSLIESRLSEEPDRFRDFWKELKRALVMAPKCAKTRMMLDLVRADTTPQAIKESLQKFGARIDCPSRPYYYITNGYRVILNDPLLTCVQAVRHFIDYSWVFDETRTNRSRTYQCWHFFPPRYPWNRGCGSQVAVSMEVPFDPGRIQIPPRPIAPRRVEGEWSYATGEGVSFCIFTIAAIASAYLTKYGADPTPVVNTLSLQDMITAILYGFGIDQLRDTVTNQSTTRLAPAVPGGTTATS